MLTNIAVQVKRNTFIGAGSRLWNGRWCRRGSKSLPRRSGGTLTAMRSLWRELLQSEPQDGRLAAINPALAAVMDDGPSGIVRLPLWTRSERQIGGSVDDVARDARPAVTTLRRRAKEQRRRPPSAARRVVLGQLL